MTNAGNGDGLDDIFRSADSSRPRSPADVLNRALAIVGSRSSFEQVMQKALEMFPGLEIPPAVSMRGAGILAAGGELVFAAPPVTVTATAAVAGAAAVNAAAHPSTVTVTPDPVAIARAAADLGARLGKSAREFMQVQYGVAWQQRLFLLALTMAILLYTGGLKSTAHDFLVAFLAQLMAPVANGGGK
jgi:hypothetical protein